MKNKEVVESVLNSYAETKGMDNWTELIGYCNNEPEEIAAHYEMAIDKYISSLIKFLKENCLPTEELVDKKNTKFIKGQWYTHTEPGQEKFLIRIEDPEKQICSGWDCKGNPFKNEWVHLGNRLVLKTKNPDHVQTINEILESNFK